MVSQLQGGLELKNYPRRTLKFSRLLLSDAQSSTHPHAWLGLKLGGRIRKTYLEAFLKRQRCRALGTWLGRPKV